MMRFGRRGEAQVIDRSSDDVAYAEYLRRLHRPRGEGVAKRVPLAVIDHRRRPIALEDRIESDRELKYELEQLAAIWAVRDHRVHDGLEPHTNLRPVASAEGRNEIARQVLEPDGSPEIR